MKSFEFREYNKKLIIGTTIIMLLLVVFVFFYFSDYIIDNEIELIVGIVAIVVLLIPGFVINKFIQPKLMLTFSDSELIVSKSGRIIKSIPCSEISMFRLIKSSLVQSLLIFSVKQSYPISLGIGNKGQQVNEFIKELKSKSDFIKTQSSNSYNSGYEEYLNKNLNQENLASVQNVKEKEKSIKNKFIWAVVCVSFVSIFIMILPFFINPKRFYNVKDGKLYYGDNEVIGVDPTKTDYLSYTVIKDSDYIYYKGEILDWADRSSFKCIKDPYYSDKNGLYTETSSLYSVNKIVPLDGDYDRQTFHSLGYGNHFFKDKNNLYTTGDIDLTNDMNILTKLELDGLDVDSFEPFQSSYWFVDRNRIYFYSYPTLRVCPEIDRISFEIVSGVVAKDKNNVYYLTRDLKTDDRDATKKDNYAILEGADVPSFYSIDERNYVDKNMTWTIRRKGEIVDVRSDLK